MIIYTAIGREKDGAVLVESSKSGCEGNFPQVTTQLLEKLKSNPNLVPPGNRKTFLYHTDMEHGDGDVFASMRSSWANVMGSGVDELDYYFHVLHGESAFYVCLSDDSGRQAGVNFSYLQDLQKDFAGKYSPNKIDRANAYGMDKAFQPNIHKLAHHYNTNRSSMGTNERVAELTAEIDDIKSVMGKNISLIMKRGETLDSLEIKSAQLEEEANVFKKKAVTLKRGMRWQHYKVQILCFLVVVFIIFLLSIAMCGPTYGKCRSSNSG